MRGRGWSVVGTGSPGFGIKFTSGGAFHREVDGQVKRLLADRALVRRAYLVLWFKALLVLLWVAASYGCWCSSPLGRSRRWRLR